MPGIGSRVEHAIRRYREWRNRSAAGPLGEFYRSGGNQLLCRDLPVGSGDVVIDVGAYRGDWTAEMSWRYGCKSILVEPIPTFVEALRERFGANDRITIVASGLGASDGSVIMTVAGDSSSSVTASPVAPQITVPVLGVATLFASVNLDDVACMKMNIEGAEYETLDAMRHHGLLERVRSLVVQFHDVGANTEAVMTRSREYLQRTHERRFAYDLVWERWDRR